MSSELEGHCDCSQVGYRLRAQPMFVHCCHCLDCQRQTGSAFVINALVERDNVDVLFGQTHATQMRTDSGRPHMVHRCTTCQTALWSVYGGVEKLRFVRVGTLKTPSLVQPDVHIYTRSKQPWVILPAGVPAFEAYYDSKKLWPAESLARRKQIIG